MKEWIVESHKLAFAHDVSAETWAISGREVQISLKIAPDKQVWAWVHATLVHRFHELGCWTACGTILRNGRGSKAAMLCVLALDWRVSPIPAPA